MEDIAQPSVKRKDYCPYGTKFQWQDYNNQFEKHSKHRLSKENYMWILNMYHNMIVDSVINGGKISLGIIGDLYIKKVNPTIGKPKKRVNWTKTREQRKKGDDKAIVYSTTEEFPLICQKKRFKGSNCVYYKFHPARGNNSFIKKLFTKVREEPTILQKYVVDEKSYYIEQRDKEDRIVFTYLTIEDVIKRNKTFKKANIKRAINNPSLTSYGYKWRSII